MKRFTSLMLVLAFAGAAAQHAQAGDGSVKKLNAGDAVSLNPQPEPPGITAKNTSMRKAGGDQVMLNPQPEPPGITAPQAKLPKTGAPNPGAAGQPAAK